MSAGSSATNADGSLTPRRLAAEYATARVLAESARLSEAMPAILEAICRTLGWDYGALWRVDPHDNVLRLIAAWHMPGTGFAEFEALSRESSFASGIGLPGRVWAAARPTFIPDVLEDANFPRAPAAAREHLHAAFGFPVVLDRDVLGVMEFFSREIREPDEELLDDARYDRPSDRPVHRATTGGRGSRPVLRAVARHAVHCRVRRLLPTDQPGVAVAHWATRTRSSTPARTSTSSIRSIARRRWPRRAKLPVGPSRCASRIATGAATGATAGFPGPPCPTRMSS